MPKFAVYFIPEQQDPLYQLGTQLLGYDVRANVFTEMPPDLQNRFPFEPFDPIWVALARPFGFHVTIGDAVECEMGMLPQVETELAALLGCFQRSTEFILTRRTSVGVWGEEGRYTVILPFVPNEALLILHTLIAARINPLGKGSGYFSRLQNGLLSEAQNLAQAQQTRLFYSPYVLDNWYPHFTLLNPYTSNHIEGVSQFLGTIFGRIDTIPIKSTCLLVQQQDEASWQIYREFPLYSAKVYGS